MTIEAIQADTSQSNMQTIALEDIAFNKDISNNKNLIADEKYLKADIALFNQYNQVLWKGKLSNGKAWLSTAYLLNGFYYLKIDDGVKPIVKQVLVQH